MVKLICQRCGQVWYTANTKPNQTCNECGGGLNEEKRTEKTSSKKHDCKVIYIK